MLFSSDDEDEFEHIDVQKSGTEKAHSLDEDKLLISSYETLKNIPSHLQKAAKKIFDKYSKEDIREWTKKYLLHYSQNHAVEPPLDLTKLKKIPFGNSDELDIKTKLYKAFESKESSYTNKYDKVEEKDKQPKDKEGDITIDSKSNNPDYDPFVKKYFKRE